jgi:hypothetical protein
MARFRAVIRRSSLIANFTFDAGRALRVAALVVMALYAGPTAARTCGAEFKKSDRVEQQIPLLRESTSTAFYMRTGAYAVLLDPATVERKLKDRIEKWRLRDDELLLDALKIQAQANQNTDIYKLEFLGVRYYLRINYLVADMLESGEVSLIDLRRLGVLEDPTIDRITLVRVYGNRSKSSARQFCAPSGDLIMDVTDEIVD